MTTDLDRAKSLLTRLREHVGFNSDGMMSSDGSYRSASKQYDLLRLEAADMIESLLSAPPSAGQESVVFSRPNRNNMSEEVPPTKEEIIELRALRADRAEKKRTAGKYCLTEEGREEIRCIWKDDDDWILCMLNEIEKLERELARAHAEPDPVPHLQAQVIELQSQINAMIVAASYDGVGKTLPDGSVVTYLKIGEMNDLHWKGTLEQYALAKLRAAGAPVVGTFQPALEHGEMHIHGIDEGTLEVSWSPVVGSDWTRDE
jgi:hypothetical protein